MIRAFPLAALAVAAWAAAPGGAGAETCFHGCFRDRIGARGSSDQDMRDVMNACRDSCEEQARARLKAEGLDGRIAACTPQPVDESELRKVRSGSPSVTAFANGFVWEVNNVLKGKIIRRVEITTQSLTLADVTLSGSGIVEPGESGAFLMNNVGDGYPAMRVSSRIKAIYACPSQ